MKSICIILPLDKGLASAHVRGLCLEGFWPNDWEAKYWHGPKHIPEQKVFRNIVVWLHYIKMLFQMRLTAKNVVCTYFIKPSSVVVMLLARVVFGYKVIIDVNDPIHLPEHLGRYSVIRFKLFLMISNGVVFESLEYKDFCTKWHNKPVAVIEDTPQFEMSYVNYTDRQMRAVWFGSPFTSKVLIEFVGYFKKLSESGFDIILLGADLKVVKILKNYSTNLVVVDKYDHKSLIRILSESTVAFVPMPKTQSYELRGNLKSKFAMASGCITVASNLKMHSRLIENQKTGYLFNGFDDFSEIINKISRSPSIGLKTIGKSANLKVMEGYNRYLHARQICDFIRIVK